MIVTTNRYTDIDLIRLDIYLVSQNKLSKIQKKKRFRKWIKKKRMIIPINKEQISESETSELTKNKYLKKENS